MAGHSAAPGSTDDADKRRKRITLLVVSASTFLLPLDYTIVAVALHDIQSSIGASFVDLQWVINGYTLVFAAFVLAAGSIADVYGRKRVFIAGMLLFATSSLACGMAPNPLFLNVARGCLGLGAALMFAASLPLLIVEFEGAERARAFGVFGAVVGIGAASGPFLGGIIIGALGWRWAFLINVPIAASLVVLTTLFVRESRDPNARGVDIGGLVSFTLFCFVLIYGVINGNEYGWGSPRIVGAFVASLLILFIFVRLEMKHHYPMFDLSLFRSATFVGASTPPIVLSIAFWGPFLYFPTYYQAALGYSPLAAGAAVLPFAIPLFVMGPVGGRLAAKLSSRTLLALGQLLVGVGALLMLLPSYDATWLGFALGALVSGTGAGLINGEMSNVAISLVPPARAGMAAGINSTARQVGVALGFAALGAVLNHVTTLRFTAATLGRVDPSYAAMLVRGDLRGVLASVPATMQESVGTAARMAFYDGFHVLDAIAGLVGIFGAVFSYCTIRAVPASLPVGSPLDD